MTLLLDSEFLTRTELTGLRNDLVTSAKSITNEDLHRICESGFFEVFLRAKSASWRLTEQREVLILGLMNRASMAERVQRSISVSGVNQLPPDVRSLIIIVQFILRVEIAAGIPLYVSQDVIAASRPKLVASATSLRNMVNEAVLLDDPIARVVCLSLLKETLRIIHEQSEVRHAELNSAEDLAEVQVESKRPAGSAAAVPIRE
jgi:hypothetical protein